MFAIEVGVNEFVAAPEKKGMHFGWTAPHSSGIPTVIPAQARIQRTDDNDDVGDNGPQKPKLIESE